ncbi:MAG: alpha/beta fold hydrolase, partial [Stellaceae bacterium]
MASDEPSILTREDGATIAYHRAAGRAPGVVFLGGFMSDMTGTKARMLDEFCRARGQAFLRFDYFAHGASSGDFAAATVGRWKEDTLAVLDRLTEGSQILAGSSLGGWLMLLAALERPERIAGLIGVAAAPDATERLM